MVSPPNRCCELSTGVPLVLGTVQLGRAYGIANDCGMPSSDVAEAILNEAWVRGIRVIDTARSYGVSEERIGMFLKRYPDHTFTVVTKISPFEGHSDESFSKGVEASIRESLRALSQSKLSTVLLHRASMIKSRAWDKLVELMSEGVIQHLGVSVQSPEEFLVAASTPQLTHIQFPFNILDYRWTESGIDKIVESRPDLVVYARSIFLQGLLSTERSVKWPAVENFSPSAIVSSIIDLARDFGRESAADLCFAYVRGQRWISSSVIGMETSAQVVENARLAGLRPLTTLEIKEAALRIPRVPVQILNPACWPR